MARPFNAARYVVRARRLADLSQRELAARLGVSHSVVGRIESGHVVPAVDLFVRILAIAGLRLESVDSSGAVIEPVAVDLARDNAGRRFPAHLDVHPIEDASNDYLWRRRQERQSPQAWFHRREERDRRRATEGTMVDQPTVTDLASYRRLVLEQRAARLRARAAMQAPSPPPPDCFCDLGCHESGPCVLTCPCQCEPETSRGLG
jgi:HTH-type transcriptional regulator/antitoxin HipB